MGMDVYGKDAKSEVGEYFRNSVWGWHPLAEFVCAVSPEITSKCKCWHTNDGDGLDEADSIALAEAIEEVIDSGEAEEYVVKRDAHMSMLAKKGEECNLCNGTGRRTDKVGMELGLNVEKGCNGCNGEGRKAPFDTWYKLDMNNIKAFVAFLKDCGGFNIY